MWSLRCPLPQLCKRSLTVWKLEELLLIYFLNYLVLDLSLFNKETDSSREMEFSSLWIHQNRSYAGNCAQIWEAGWKKIYGPIVDCHLHSLMHFSQVSTFPKRLGTTRDAARMQPQKGFCASWLQITVDHDAVVDNLYSSQTAPCQRMPPAPVRTRPQRKSSD